MGKTDFIIGIDPDVEKSGWAFVNMGQKTAKTDVFSFPDLLDMLKVNVIVRRIKRETYIVVIEAGWLNESNWHLDKAKSKAMAAQIGNNTGRNHEVGRKIAEICECYGYPYVLKKPLKKIWKGKDGKITQEEIMSLMAGSGVELKTKRMNQEARDALLLAMDHSGVPLKMKR